MPTFHLTSRADLAMLPSFKDLARDGHGTPIVVDPATGEWTGPDDRLSRALWSALPPEGSIEVPIPVFAEHSDMVLIDGYAVVGRDEPRLVRAGPWPDFDAFVRSRVPDLDPRAVVFAANGGEPGSPPSSLTAGVIQGKTATARCTIKVKKVELAAFCDAWCKENLPIRDNIEPEPARQPEPEPESEPSFQH